MPRPLRKTAATSLKMTPEVRNLWDKCATGKSGSLTNMFEVMVRVYAKKLGLHNLTEAVSKPATKDAIFKRAKQ